MDGDDSNNPIQLFWRNFKLRFPRATLNLRRFFINDLHLGLAPSPPPQVGFLFIPPAQTTPNIYEVLFYGCANSK